MAAEADGAPPLSPAVTGRIDAAWADEDVRAILRDALAGYGVEVYEREADRVRLAILKLAAGDANEALSLVAAAKRDYRDVLMWAEYPEEGRTLWSLRPALTADERARLDDIRHRDREQYRAWLRASQP